MLQQVGEVTQGAMVRMPLKFNTGVMRGAFNPVDGQLYVCGLRGWQTRALRDGAFYRVRYTGESFAQPTSVEVMTNGVVKFRDFSY